MSKYRIGNVTIDGEDARLNDLLAGIYGKQRPLCLCVAPPIEMYIAKISGRYFIKRMPNSGSDHAATCDSYEPPAELSGLGQVMGSAIQENAEEGLTALKFDFSLSKGGSRAAPIASDAESDSVKTDGNKLSLRAALHYLWEEGGFNRWWPAMAGKRNWNVIRKFLLQAAENKTAKGAGLSEILYIPETFILDRKDEIAQRRMAQMHKIATPTKGQRKLMLLVGEVKEIAQARYGHKLVVKHLPDCHFMLNEDIHKRLNKRFGSEMALWGTVDGAHLMVIGTFSVSDTGVSSLEEAALMVVTENWIPFENMYDKMLIDALTSANRRFVKGLRYNLPSNRPLACAVLLDTQPVATAMYIIPPGATDDYLNAMNTLVDESKLANWVWNSADASMPAIAPRTSGQAPMSAADMR